ncbi:MAG: aldo/keto reductase [Chloroflexi bacterium]|nr:aldo/keto reductase [Chloroflexota bacterium]
MNYRHLGRSGLKVSELSLGSWVSFGIQIAEDVARECVAAAYDAGVNFFDNAEVYAGGKSESVMGAVLKKMGWRRGSYIVSTKFFWGLHNGPNEKNSRGKAIYWGTSMWSAAEIMAAWQIADKHHLHKPVMEQPQYNMLHRERVEREYARLYLDIGLGTTIWSPLASGLLTGKYNDGIPADSRATLKGYEWLKPHITDPARIEIVKRLVPIASDLGVSLAQMALAWCLKNPNISTVITGASRVEQVKENMKALDVVDKLTPDVMARIDEALGNKPQEDD